MPLRLQLRNTKMNFKKPDQIISIIEKMGYVALIVGGAVRDHVMGRPVLDIDLATDMPLDQLSKIFKSRGIGKSRDFGILSIEYQGRHFEISSFRGESESPGHFSDLEEKKRSLFHADARRRDFTINAMAMDARRLIFDPFQGRIDIEKKIIRTTDNTDRIFSDDPVRMLRAVRFACVFNFEIESKTLSSIKKLCHKIRTSAPERITLELMNLASMPGRDFAKGLALLRQLGLLEQILPEIHRLSQFNHHPDHHPEGGVFQHTMKALEANEKADPKINLCILFHDSGKAMTFQIKNGRPAYHRHDKAGEIIIRNVGQRLKFPRKLVDLMCFVALNHMKGLKINEMRPAKAFRLMNDPHWPVLKSVISCDLMSRSKSKAQEFDRTVDELSLKLGQWLDQKKSASRPVITGRQIMEYTGLPQGPEIGLILENTTNWAINNNIIDQDRIREYVLGWKFNVK